MREEKTFADLGNTKYTWTGLTSKEYQAFTPALLYWNTTHDRDMVRDFAARLNKSTRIKVSISPFPIFDIDPPLRELEVSCGGAVGDRKEILDLSRTLYFCPKSIWPELRNYLISYGSVDVQKQRVAFAAECPVMQIPDYVRMAQGHMPPGVINIASIGIYASDFCSLWRNDPSNPFVRPRAVKTDRCETAYYDGMMFLKGRV